MVIAGAAALLRSLRCRGRLEDESIRKYNQRLLQQVRQHLLSMMR